MYETVLITTVFTMRIWDHMLTDGPQPKSTRWKLMAGECIICQRAVKWTLIILWLQINYKYKNGQLS